MITLAGFLVGLFLLGVGFLMIWKSHRWIEYVGSLNSILGYPRLQWLDWDTLGIILMVAGVLLAFGLFQAFLAMTIGRFFQFAELRG